MLSIPYTILLLQDEYEFTYLYFRVDTVDENNDYFIVSHTYRRLFGMQESKTDI